MELDLESQARLVDGLFRLLNEQGSDSDAELIETHISWVLLSGKFAYKIKKSLNLGFVDFSTLARRHFCCQEELRLNRRLAPDVYLDVIAITGTIELPLFSGSGEIIEYCVKMRRFSQEGLLSHHPKLITERLVASLAGDVAGFHADIDRAGPQLEYGSPERIIRPVLENFEQIQTLLDDSTLEDLLSELRRWTVSRFQLLRGTMERRKSEGFVRECHGDLHLGNIALEADRLIIFDGIEFNPDLRWVDTMSELAFLLMDIEEKGSSRLSWRLLDSYLEITGDYRGLEMLNFYIVYRAMVRAKVSSLRSAQSDTSEAERRALAADVHRYLETAQKHTHAQAVALLITHGLSASGKSTYCRQLLEQLPAVRLRSDVERKRLAGLKPDDRSHSPPGAVSICKETLERHMIGYWISVGLCFGVATM